VGYDCFLVIFCAGRDVMAPIILIIFYRWWLPTVNRMVNSYFIVMYLDTNPFAPFVDCCRHITLVPMYIIMNFPLKSPALISLI